MYFSYFLVISPWKSVGLFIWTNLNPRHPKMLCAKFGWNWSSGSGEEDFLISSVYFHYFVIISPWTRVRPFIWTKLNRLHPTMHCASLVEIGPVVLEKKIFKISSMYNYLPLEKGRALHLNKLDSLQPRILCAKFGWNWPSGSREEENVKSLRQRQHQWRTTDKFWSEKLTLASGELKI